MISDQPEGWASEQLVNIADLNPSKPPQDALPASSDVTFLPMAAVSEDGTVIAAEKRRFAEVRKGYTAFADDDVLVAKITPCFENGKAAVVRGLVNGLGFGSSEFHVLRSTGAVTPEYLFHFLRQQSFRDTAAAHMTGTAGQARVPADFMRSVELPLPPLAEQRRIVDRIEALLVEVNAVRERLTRIPDILKRLRDSVLAAACSGRLTNDWRSAQAGRIPEWVTYPLGELCESGRVITYGVVKLGNATPKGVPCLRTSNVRWLKIETEGIKLIGRALSAEYARTVLKGGEVLVNVRGTLGGVAVVEPRMAGWNVSREVAVVPVDTRRIDSAFLSFVVGSQASQQWLGSVEKGVAYTGINIEDLRKLPVALPSLAEQREIVRRVTGVFDSVAELEAHSEAASSRVAALSQSILAKAFRGGLVPTEAELARKEGRSYEPASALLARISMQRTEPAPRSTSRRSKLVATNAATEEKALPNDRIPKKPFRADRRADTCEGCGHTRVAHEKGASCSEESRRGRKSSRCGCKAFIETAIVAPITMRKDSALRGGTLLEISVTPAELRAKRPAAVRLTVANVGSNALTDVAARTEWGLSKVESLSPGEFFDSELEVEGQDVGTLVIRVEISVGATTSVPTTISIPIVAASRSAGRR